MAIPGGNQSTSVKEYAYIMASTLNQMVNYIPLKMKFSDIKFINIYNVTLKKKLNDKEKVKVKDNSDWDENFKKVVTDLPITNIEIDQYTEWLNVANTLEQINNTIKNETKPIFWNITGGQRPFLMAVWELTKKRPNDVIAYLEGNTGKIVLLKQDEKEGLVCKDSKTDYAIEGLTIDIALELMGYNLNGIKKSENLLENTDKQNLLMDFYSKFYKAYRDDNNKNDEGKTLREIMPEFNSNSQNFDAIISKFPTIQGLTQDEIKKEWQEYAARKTFGYILEDMLVYLLLESIKKNNLEKNIAGVYPSTKISAGYMDSNKTIDEFDTLILTKTGQIISFEAKSGSMNSDVAKSTNYSTYAIAGVYGLPILITPRINESDNLDTNNKNISKAISAARRANLEVWYLDDITTKIKEKLGL